MFCSECGNKNENDANFCISCGNKIYNKEKNTLNNKKNITLKRIILLLIVITGFVVLIIYYTQEQTKKKQQLQKQIIKEQQLQKQIIKEQQLQKQIIKEQQLQKQTKYEGNLNKFKIGDYVCRHIFLESSNDDLIVCGFIKQIDPSRDGKGTILLQIANLKFNNSIDKGFYLRNNSWMKLGVTQWMSASSMKFD